MRSAGSLLRVVPPLAHEVARSTHAGIWPLASGAVEERGWVCLWPQSPGDIRTADVDGRLTVLGALQWAFWGQSSPEVVSWRDEHQWGLYVLALAYVERAARRQFGREVCVANVDEFLTGVGSALDLLFEAYELARPRRRVRRARRRAA